MNAHTKSASVDYIDIDGQLESMEKAARILCWLAEQCEKNINTLKGRMIPADVEVFDELVVEQAYLVKSMVTKLKRDIGLSAEVRS